jgi:phosphoribosylamine---glycine ligase
MMRYSGDLVALMLSVATGTLADADTPAFISDTALTVVMAANGYPGTLDKGGMISLGKVTGAKVFHAGTAEKDGQLVASGGRVLNVTATGANVTEAQKAAYNAVDLVEFPTGFCRRDIGWREVEREGNL